VSETAIAHTAMASPAHPTRVRPGFGVPVPGLVTSMSAISAASTATRDRQPGAADADGRDHQQRDQPQQEDDASTGGTAPGRPAICHNGPYVVRMSPSTTSSNSGMNDSASARTAIGP
jgi:hypothetical protein